MNIRKNTIKIVATLGLTLIWLLAGLPNTPFTSIFKIKEVQAITCGFGTEIGSTGVCRGFLTVTGSNQTWTSPSDWNNSNNTIECIGGGGAGGATTKNTSYSATGGGAGAYSLISNFTVATPGTTTATYRIGAGGAATNAGGAQANGNPGEDTWFNNSTFPGAGTNNTYCGAKGGGGGNAGVVTQSGGAGGVGTSGWGETRRNGGSGGGATHSSVATGGGGAAGNSNVGGAGVSSSTTNSATNGGQANGSGASGGTGVNGGNGGTGGSGTEYTTEGSGGGGGGGRDTTNSYVYGGTAGKRGGGGGGAVNWRTAGTPNATSGAGYDGIIVITYTPATTTISGTIYQENESLAFDCSNGGPYTVYLRVNGLGTYSGSCNADTGAWEVTGITNLSSGQTIYAYIYNESVEGSTVLITDGTAQSDVPIYVNRVALRDDVNGSITAAEILAGNTSDDDDLITTGGTNIIVGPAYETHIYDGDTFAPNDNVSTGRLHIDGSAIFTAGSNTLTLTGTSGTLLTREGTFTQGTGTVSVTSASGAPTLLSAATTFHALTINSTATVINDGAAVSLENASGANLTLTAGVLNFITTPTGPGSGNGTLTISSGATMCLGGGATNTSASCNSVAAATTAVTMPTFQTYTFNSSSNVIYLSDADTSVSSTPAYGNLYLRPLFDATSRTYTLGGAMTINGDLVINPDETGAGSPALTVNSGGTITVASGKTTTITATNSASSTLDINPGTSYNLSTGILYIDSGGTLDATSASSTITLTGNAGTLFTRYGNFTITSGTPTVTVTGGTGTTLNSQTITFYNLTISPSGTSTINTSTDNITVTGTLNVASGDTFSLPSGQTLTHSGSTLTLSGIISGDGTYIYSSNGTLPTGGTLSTAIRFDATDYDQTVTNRNYSGTVELYSSSSASDRTFTLGTAGSQTITFGSNLTLNAAGSNAITVSGASNSPTVNITGNLDSTAGNGTENITTGTNTTWTVTGNVDLTDVGTFTATGNTFQMNGTGVTLTSATESFNNFYATGGSITTTDSTTIGGNFDITGSASFTHNSGDMTVTGTFDVTSGTFAHGTGGTGSNLDIYIAGDFTLANGITWTENVDATSQVTLDGDLDYTDGNAPSKSIGNVVIGASPATTNLTTDFAANSLTVIAGDFFNTCEYEVDIGNLGITINGTLDASASGNAGSVNPCSAGNEGNESTINDAQSFTLASGGTLVADASTIIMDDPSGTDDFITLGTGNPYNLTILTGGATIEVEDPLTVTNNLTITSGTLDVVSGESNQINVGGNWTNDATFVEQSGKVVLDGTDSTTLDSNCTTPSSCTTGNFYDLEINKTDSGDTVTLTNFGIRTTHNLTIVEGTLVQGTYDVYAEGTSAVSVEAGGTWTNTSTGDLTLAGTFANEGTATFQGTTSACGEADAIAIASTDTNVRNWTGGGTFNINDITCSYQSSTPTIAAYSSTNSGSTCSANWVFVNCPQTISGNVYDLGTTDAMSYCDADSGTYELYMVTDSLPYYASCSNANGGFSFADVGVPSAGEAIVIWIDDTEASEADGALVLRYDGSGDSSDNIFYSDAVTVMSDDTNAVTIDNMDTYDFNNDNDIPYTATSGSPDTLSVNSGYELYVLRKSTVAADSTVFDPGGTVATNATGGDLHIAANTTAYLDTDTNAIGRDIEVDDSATLYIDAATTVGGGDITTGGTGAAVTTSTGSPTVTVTTTGGAIGGGTTPTLTFHNLTTSGSSSLDISDTTTINNDLTVGAGTTLNINASMDIAGSLTTTSDAIVTNASGSPTVTMSGAGQSIGGGTGAITFYGLTLSNDGTTTVNSDITVSNTLNVTTSDTMSIAATKAVTVTTTLTFPDTAVISGSGTLIYQGSSTFPTTGTLSAPLRYDATNNDHTIPVRTYSGNVELYSNSGSNDRTFTLGTAGSQTITFGANLTLNAANTNAITLTGESNAPDINITGNLDSTAGNGTENITTGANTTWTVTGNVDLTDVGTFTASSGNTLVMDGSSTTITSNTSTLQNFEVQGTVSNADNMDVNGTFTVTSGTFTQTDSDNVDINVAGNFTIESGAAWTAPSTYATAELIFDGDLIYNDKTASQNVGFVKIGASPDTTYLSSDFSANSLTVTASDDYYYTCGWEVDIGNGGITINGTFDATRTEAGCSASDSDQSTINDFNLFNLSGTGTFVPDQSTIIFDDTSGTNDLITAGSGSFYNMQINGASNTMLLKDALDVDNDLTITAGTLDTESGSNWQINVGGDWTNDATFEERSGKVVFDGSSASTNLDSNCSDVSACTGENFYDIEINKTGGSSVDDVILTNFGIRVTNTITVTDGELVQGAYNVQVEDTSASGTAVTITSDGEWYNISTGNLVIGGDFSNAGTATFQGNGTACGDADDIAISSLDSPTDYNWAGSGTFTINDITCSDMTSTPTINAYSSTNSGSTCGANWNFVGCPVDITGTVYDFGTSDALDECNGTSQTLELRVANTTQTTSCNDSTGEFTFSSVPGPSTGDGLVIWIDSTVSGGTKGVMVVRYDGAGSSADNIFYDDAVTVTSDDTNAVDILDMDFYDKGDDGDIPYTATDADPDTLVVDSGYELYILLKSTVANDSTVFDPGGTVTTNATGGDLHIAANTTAYLDTDTNAIGRDIEVDDSATLYIDAATTVGGGDITTGGTGAAVTTSTGSPTVTVTTTGGAIGGGTTPTLTFHNLTTSGSSSLDIADTATINNDLTVGANTTLTNSAAVTVTNDVTVNGTLTVGASLNIDGGNLTTGSGATVDYSSTPTVDIDGTGTLGGNSVTTQFYNLDLGDGTSDTTTLGSNTQVDNSLTVNTSQTFAMATYDVTVGSTSAVGSGDIAVNGATSQSASGTLTIKSSASEEADLTGSGTLTVYNLTIGDGATAMTFDQDTADTAVDIANDLTITASATFSATSGTGLNVGGSYANSGTFTANGGRITFDDADGGETLSGTMAGGSAFYDIVFDDNTGSGAWTFGNNNAAVTHDFIITDGTVTAPGSGYTLTISEDFNNNDASGSFVHNSGEVVFNGSNDSYLLYNATTTFNDLTIATASKQMYFEDTDDIETDIDGDLSIQGSDCTTGRIFLDGNGANEWEINVTDADSVDIDYVDVQDSKANTTSIDADNSTEDNEGNTNWNISGGVCSTTEHQVNIRGDVNVQGNTRIK